MGRQRKNPQSKIKEESPEKELNEIEASNLSAIQFEIVIIRMLKDLSENFNKLYMLYGNLCGSYNNMKKYIETKN